MKVLIFEDDDDKFAVISAEIRGCVASQVNVLRVKALSEFFKEENRVFDFCVIDLWLPLVLDGTPQKVARDIIAQVEQAGGLRVPVLAITAFFKEAAEFVELFSQKGCLILDYADCDAWKPALKTYILQAKDRHRYDFLIFCAIEEERNAFLKLGIPLSPVMRSGLEFCDLSLDGATGAIVLLHKMGLVSAAISTARVLETFSPKVICMSGICGGLKSNSSMGQLLVTEFCWEYQSGKWSDECFAAEPYQVEIAEQTRIHLASTLADRKILKELEADFEGENRPSKIAKPKLAAFASGSAIIASQERLNSVKSQHRKVAGIDMEIYGFHRAVRMCDETIVHFSAKTVVDHADEDKSDILHDYGCFISAKFCLKVVKSLFTND